jgi:hypothetical protein
VNIGVELKGGRDEDGIGALGKTMSLELPVDQGRLLQNNIDEN